jgi:hypothetical protein
MFGDSLELVSALGGLTNGSDPVSRHGTERRKRVRTRLLAGIDVPRLAWFQYGRECHQRPEQRWLYCLTRIQFIEGERLVCSIRMPTHDPHGKHLERTLECTVSVVRVVPQESADSSALPTG